MNTIQTSSRFDSALQVSQQRQSNETTSSFATLLQSKTQPAKEVDEADLAIQEKIDKEIESLQKQLDDFRASFHQDFWDNTPHDTPTLGENLGSQYAQQLEKLKELRDGSAENRAQWDKIDKLLSQNSYQPASNAVSGVRQAALEMTLAGAGDVAEEMIQSAVANNDLASLEKAFSGAYMNQQWKFNEQGGFFELDLTNPKQQSSGLFTSTTRNGILDELGEMFSDKTKDFTFKLFGIDDDEQKQPIESSIQSLLAIIQNAHNSFAERNLTFIENETQEFLARFGAK